MRDRAVERTSVAVRYDPFDVTVGFAWINKQWRKCVCPADDLAGCGDTRASAFSSRIAPAESPVVWKRTGRDYAETAC